MRAGFNSVGNFTLLALPVRMDKSLPLNRVVLYSESGNTIGAFSFETPQIRQKQDTGVGEVR